MSATARRRARPCRSRGSRPELSSRSRRSRTSDVVIRRAGPADARGIARVRRKSWTAAYAHVFTSDQLDSISEHDDAARWEGWLSAPPERAAAFVAAGGEEITGFSSLGLAMPGDDPEIGELFTMYVLPERWGEGIGRALMATTLAQLRAEGYREAVLWVLADNPRTRLFYERGGWRADGGVKDEEWLGATIREVRYRIGL